MATNVATIRMTVNITSHTPMPKGRRNMTAAGAVKGIIVSHIASVPAGCCNTHDDNNRVNSIGTTDTSTHCKESASASSFDAQTANNAP